MNAKGICDYRQLHQVYHCSGDGEAPRNGRYNRGAKLECGRISLRWHSRRDGLDNERGLVRGMIKSRPYTYIEKVRYDNV